MSIALLVKSGGDGDALVPVATQATFRQRWSPGCDALGLRWLPLFETGISLTAADLPEVLGELRSLRAWLEQHDPGTLAMVAERIDRLADELEKLGARADVELFIG